MIMGLAVLLISAPAPFAAPPPWQTSILAHYESGRLYLERMQTAWRQGDLAASCSHFNQGVGAWKRALGIVREAPLSPGQRLLLEQHRRQEERRLEPWRVRCHGRSVPLAAESPICLRPERSGVLC